MTIESQNILITNPEQLERALGFNVVRLASLFKKELLKALSDDEMSAEQWQIMATLWWTNPSTKIKHTEPQVLTQIEICNLTLKDKPTVSRMIDVMVKRNWVKKIASEYDARKTYIALTPFGKKLKDEISKKLMHHFVPILSPRASGLTAEEHATLLKLLKKARVAFGDVVKTTS